MKKLEYKEKEQKEVLGRKQKKKKMKWWKRILLVLCLFVLFCCGAIGGYLGYTLYKAPAIGIPLPNQVDEQGNVIVSDSGRKEGVYTILVVGRDKVALNTDTILLARFDTKNNQINILSIPRDTMSNVKRYVKKINAAYSVGGSENPDQLKKEVRDLVGFTVDRYVVVNLSAFEELIDELGGVTVDVKKAMKYRDPYQNLTIDIPAGEQKLNGAQAVGFVRYRSGYASGDLGRVEAQQQFIQALAQQAKSPATLKKLPKLAQIIKDNMETDLSTQDIVWFGQQAMQVDMATGLTTYTLPGDGDYIYTGSQYVSYYLPYANQIIAMINESFNPYLEDLDSTDFNIVDISNLKRKGSGSGTTGDKNQSNPSSSVGEDDTAGEASKENKEPTGEMNEETNIDPETNTDAPTTELITDAKGNIYEVDIETGKVISVFYEAVEDENGDNVQEQTVPPEEDSVNHTDSEQGEVQ